MTSSLPEDDDLIAAEYVLGVQDAETRAKTEQWIKRDPAFAAAVLAWEVRLGGLNDDFAPVPAPDLMPAIEARLFPVAARPARNWFGWVTGGAVAASLALAVLVTLPTAPQPLLTTMAAGDVTYEVRTSGAQLKITRVAGLAAPAGQVHELWVIAPGAAPVSLGLLADGPLQVTYPVPPAGWVFAVSLEPAGGSPTGSPTGPVLMSAEIGV